MTKFKYLPGYLLEGVDVRRRRSFAATRFPFLILWVFGPEWRLIAVRRTRVPSIYQDLLTLILKCFIRQALNLNVGAFARDLNLLPLELLVRVLGDLLDDTVDDQADGDEDCDNGEDEEKEEYLLEGTLLVGW